MIRPNRVPALLGALALVAGLGTLVGCGGDEQTGVTETADKLSADSGVESPAASTDAASADSAASDGAATTATEGLPEGFPSDDVPLLSEQVLTGSAGGPDGEFAWSVVLQSSRAVSDVSAEVRKEFTAAGYTAGPGDELGDLSVMQFTGPKYEVGVTAARAEGRVVITYVVRDLS
jgi:hypothetical protein